MSTVLSNPGPSAAGNKLLWGAVGVLGVSTLALGAVVVRQQMGQAQPEDPIEIVAIHSPAKPVAVESTQPPLAVAALAAKPVVSDKKAPLVPVKYAQAAPKSGANQVPAKVHAPVVAPAAGVQVTSTPVAVAPVAVAPVAVAVAPEQVQHTVQPPVETVCATCGVVQSVTPLQRESANPSGAGTAAGALLGGLLGNQFGGGDGKALATIAGVLGGSWAGHAVENRLKKETVYIVEVRMDDGSVRSIEQAASASIGQHVTVEGNRITPARQPI